MKSESVSTILHKSIVEQVNETCVSFLTLFKRKTMPVAIKEHVSKLTSHAETIRNTDPIVYETCSVGDGHWQGDLCVQFVGKDFNVESISNGNVTKLDQNPSQLVNGNNIGSRHVLKKDDSIEAWKINNPLIPFALKAPNGLTVEHPTHGDVTMKESGFYIIRCQREPKLELSRMKD